MTYHVLIDYSKGSPSRKKWTRCRDRFSGLDVVVHNTETEGITRVCREITEKADGEIVLVVIGGDGALNRAVNGIRDFDRVRIGYLPAGSANDFARSMGILHKDEETIESIRKGEVVHAFDLGFVRYLEDNMVRGRYFFNSMGLGYDAAICAAAEGSVLKGLFRRLHLGKLIYLTEAVHLLFQSPMVPMSVRLDKDRRLLTRKGFFAACMNHLYEGGGFPFCPDADPADGILDLCLVSDLFRPDFFRIFPKVYKGDHLKYPCVHIYKAKNIDIKTSIPLWLHVDGDPLVETTQIHAHIIPGKLRFIM